MDFTFMAPHRLIVRQGGLNDIGAVCEPYMKRACLFRYGDAFFTPGVHDVLTASLKDAGIEFYDFGRVGAEPSPGVVNAAADFMRENNCDGALAIGGGSPIDAAKAACALAPNGADIKDHLEGFKNLPFKNKPLPLVAVPTTAGTGTECTKNAVITQKGEFKKSVRADLMLPVAALIDARLMTSVPKTVTAESGADCLCQLIEAYVSKKAEPFTDAISLHFTKTAFYTLPKVFVNGADIDAREKMALSACASGMAMANGGLGAAHGLASGLGALTGLSHGLICGVLLPHIIKLNASKGVHKYADITRVLTEKDYANKADAVENLVVMVEELNKKIGIPPNFAGLGITKSQIPAIVTASMGSSMSGNPAPVTSDELTSLLESLI